MDVVLVKMEKLYEKKRKENRNKEEKEYLKCGENQFQPENNPEGEDDECEEEVMEELLEGKWQLQRIR